MVRLTQPLLCFLASVLATLIAYFILSYIPMEHLTNHGERTRTRIRNISRRIDATKI